jgi:hypothetical protein
MSGDHPAHGTRSARDRRRSYGWTVTLDAMGAPSSDLQASTEKFEDLLQPYGGDVTLDLDNSRYGATFSLGEPNLDAASALAYGYELFRDLATHAGLPLWPIVHAEVTQVSDQRVLRVVR